MVLSTRKDENNQCYHHEADSLLCLYSWDGIFFDAAKLGHFPRGNPSVYVVRMVLRAPDFKKLKHWEYRLRCTRAFPATGESHSTRYYDDSYEYK